MLTEKASEKMSRKITINLEDFDDPIIDTGRENIEKILNLRSIRGRLSLSDEEICNTLLAIGFLCLKEISNGYNFIMTTKDVPVVLSVCLIQTLLERQLK